jgi:hypothetical protein
LSLFAAGVVLFLLLVASYSGRAFWIALGSVALSMVALIGFLFVATLQYPAQVKPRLAWLASKLPLVLDQKTADGIANALAKLPGPPPSSCEAGQQAACGAAASAAVAADTANPADTASPAGAEDAASAASTTDAEPPSAEPGSMQAAATPSWTAPPPPPKQEQKLAASGPVVWLLDEQHPQASPGGSDSFAINGMNSSEQAMDQVHAILKPDGGHREIDLALNVDGQKTEGVIPAGARFSLAAPKGEASQQSGGAILTFRYSQGAQQRTAILYLTPAMISRLANRG